MRKLILLLVILLGFTMSSLGQEQVKLLRVTQFTGTESDPIYASDSIYTLWWSDTLLKIATKYDIDTIHQWVIDEGFLKSFTELDPVWLSDSVDFISKYDTVFKVATRYWVNNQGFLKSYTEIDPKYANDSIKIIWWADTLTKIATQYDLSLLGVGEQMYADTTRNIGYDATYFYVDSLVSTVGGGLNWSDTTGNLATDYNLLLKQNVSDTSSLDATRYWVGQQGFITSGLEWSDTTAVGGVGLATAYDLTQISGGGEQMYSDTTRNIGYDATYFYVDSLVATVGGGGLNWSDTTGNLATDYNLTFKQNVSDTSSKDATRYWVGQQGFLDWADTTAVGNKGIATYYDLYRKQDDSDTTRNVGYDATYFYVDSLVKPSYANIDAPLFESFPSVIIRNLENRNKNLDGETRYRVTVHNTVDDYVVFNYPVPLASGILTDADIDTIDGSNRWGVYENYATLVDIDSLAPTRDTAWYNTAVTGGGSLVAGDSVVFFNPFRNTKYLSRDPLLTTATLSPACTYIQSGATWRHTNGTYYMIVNGYVTSTSKFRVWLATSTDKVNWSYTQTTAKYLAGTAPFDEDWINATGHLFFTGTPCPLPDNDTLYYDIVTVTKPSSAYLQFGVVIFDQSFNVKWVSPDPITVSSIPNDYGQGQGGIKYWKGKFWISFINRGTSATGPTWKAWELEMGDVATGEVIDTNLIHAPSNEDSWDSHHLDAVAPLLYLDGLYYMIGGTGSTTYTNTIYYGNRTYGLVKKVDGGFIECPTNPVISAPIEGETIWGDDLLWATDHIGGYFNYILEGDTLFVYYAANNASNTYQVFGTKTPLKPIEYDLTLEWGDTIAVDGIGIATAYDISDMVEFADTNTLIATKYDVEELTGGGLVWSDTTTTPGLATQYDLTSKQEISDTSTWDATRYWIEQQGYITSGLEWSDTTVVGGVGLATAYDLSQVSGGDLSWADTATVPGLATQYDISSKEDPLLFRNGLTRTVDTIELGGSLLKYTTISADTGINFAMYNLANNIYHDVFIDTAGFTSEAYNDVANYSTTFRAVTNPLFALAEVMVYDSDPTNLNSGLKFTTDKGLSIKDSIFSKGLYYTSDYSANFTNRSLIDKGYADGKYAEWADTATTPGFATQYDIYNMLEWSDTSSQIATAYDLSLKESPLTFSNGLTRSVNAIKLGGLLTETTTTVEGIDKSYTYSFHDVPYNLYTDIQYSKIGFASSAYDDGASPAKSAILYAKTNASPSYGRISAYATSSGAKMGFEIYTNTGMTVYDAVRTVGLEYAADYSANYTTRSLIDKGYADGKYLDWSDTTAVGGVGVATAYDLTQIGGGDLSWSDTTAVGNVGIATYYDLLAKQNVSDTTTKDATRYWVGQQDYLVWSDTTGNIGTDYEILTSFNNIPVLRNGTKKWVYPQTGGDGFYLGGATGENYYGGTNGYSFMNVKDDSIYFMINQADFIKFRQNDIIPVVTDSISIGNPNWRFEALYLDNGKTTFESLETQGAIVIGLSSQTVKEAGTIQYTAGNVLQYYNGSGWLTPVTTEVDGSVSNEGSLGVGVGGADDATVTSNTSGSSTVTFTAGTNIDVTENTSTPSITIATESDVVDYTGTQASGNVSYFTEDGNTMSGEAAFTYNATSNTLTADTVYSSIKLNRATTTYSGIVRLYTTGAAGVTAYNLVYLSGDNTVLPVDRDAVGTAKTLGMVLETKTSGQQVRVITSGIVYNSAWNWTAGGYLYNSSTAGEITTTVPATAGYGQRVAIAVDADRIEIQIGSLVGF